MIRIHHRKFSDAERSPPPPKIRSRSTSTISATSIRLYLLSRGRDSSPRIRFYFGKQMSTRGYLRPGRPAPPSSQRDRALERPRDHRTDPRPGGGTHRNIARKVVAEVHAREADASRERVDQRSDVGIEGHQGRRRGERGGAVAGGKRRVERLDADDEDLAVDEGPPAPEHGLDQPLHQIGSGQRGEGRSDSCAAAFRTPKPGQPDSGRHPSKPLSGV